VTNLILTVIGITLVAATGLMALFYGGDAFYSSQTRIEAARLMNEGSQLHQAVTNYRARYGRHPGDRGTHQQVLNDLVDKRFLAEIPDGARTPWVFDYPNGLIRSEVGPVGDAEAQAVCSEARARMELPNPEQIFRCDGSDHPNRSLPANEPCCIF
jgi:hypothetical protein